MLIFKWYLYISWFTELAFAKFSFLYLPERQTLFDLFEHYIPKFPNLTKKQKLEIILRGIDIENPEYLQTNITLTIGVQKYIFNTKRFSQ